MNSRSWPRALSEPTDRFSASNHAKPQAAVQRDCTESDAVKRGVLAMYRQGEPNELIAMALGISILQIRSIIAAQESAASFVSDRDDPSQNVKQVARKSRHPDRCKGCGAMLTIKPCLACTLRLARG